MLFLIVNPLAGRGRAKSVAGQVETALKARGIAYRRTDTEYAGHATFLAKAAVAAKAEGIVSVGGDGTNYEVVNGVGESGARVYFVPCGTGNDFRRVIGLPKDPLEALANQLDGEDGALDLCRANAGYYLNVSGIGFDTMVLRQAARFKRLRGEILPYLLGVFAAIRRFRAPALRVTADGESLEGNFTIMAVANGRYLGGGMKVAPDALPDDGLFDVILVDAVPRWKIPFLLPRFITGSFVSLACVRVLRARQVSVEPLGAQYMTVDLDGELRDVPRIDYQLRAGGLKVRLPSVSFCKNCATSAQ